MKDLRNIIADNKRVAEKATKDTTSLPTDKVDNEATLVGRLVQVDQPLDEYAGMIGRVLKPANLEGEVVVDFSNSPFVSEGVAGEYRDRVHEQAMDLFPLDEL